MGTNNIDRLRKTLADSKRDYSYVVIDNLKVDFRNLKRISHSDVVDYQNKKLNYLVYGFECCLKNLCDDLIKSNIPFDAISVTGEPGLIVGANKHQIMIEKFLKRNYENYLNSVLKSISPSCKWTDEDTKNYISNLTIDDTLYNYVPFNFTLEPLITLNNYLYSPFKYLGLNDENEFKFSDIVPFDEFIEAIKEDGYHLTLTGQELTNYDDYFEKMRKATRYDSLSMYIDLTDSNNIRR